MKGEVVMNGVVQKEHGIVPMSVKNISHKDKNVSDKMSCFKYRVGEDVSKRI